MASRKAKRSRSKTLRSPKMKSTARKSQQTPKELVRRVRPAIPALEEASLPGIDDSSINGDDDE